MGGCVRNRTNTRSEMDCGCGFWPAKVIAESFRNANCGGDIFHSTGADEYDTYDVAKKALRMPRVRVDMSAAPALS